MSSIQLTHRASVLVACMLAFFTCCVGAASIPQPSLAKTNFMNAMRETALSKDKRQRKRRMFQEMYKRAVPVPKDSPFSRRRLADDDAGDDGNGDDEYADYGFDISAYSLKYAGCSSISTYSADMAADYYTDSVTTNSQFAVFRFCPSDSCSSNTAYGCMDDYGEYMLPIADWLDIIHDYREEEFERYCEYCANCYNGGGDDRRLEEGGDDAAAEEDEEEAGDDAAQEEEEAADDAAQEEAADDGYAADYGNCAYASSCGGYADVCEAENYDFSQLFGCVEFDFSDDLVLYVGPHCKSDKSTIALSIFTDEYCTEYSSIYDLQTLTGVSIGDDALLEYYNTDCIACKESVSLSPIRHFCCLA